MLAAAVIPAPVVYIKDFELKMLVVGSQKNPVFNSCMHHYSSYL